LYTQLSGIAGSLHVAGFEATSAPSCQGADGFCHTTHGTLRSKIAEIRSSRRRSPVIRSTLLFGILFCAPALFAQQPVEPSMRQADRAEAQNQKDMPPPLNPRVAIDPVKLRQNADELATLAQSVPTEVDQTTRGVLPKDLTEKLKRIEKLAKQLRSQISQ
jgi:hypothetical protein